MPDAVDVPAESATRPDEDPKRRTECADLPLGARIEALLLTSDRPLGDARLGELLGVSGAGAAATIRAAIDELNASYESTGRVFRAQRLAGGWQLLTLPEYAPLLERLHEARAETRLSHAALETLAIIAYRQPIMRAEIEAIRGVAAGEVVRGLMERRLIKVVGRAEQLGRPMLYGTTPSFLKVFGLSGLDDLPPIDDLPAPTAAAPPAAAEVKPEPAPAPPPPPDDADTEEASPDTAESPPGPDGGTE